MLVTQRNSLGEVNIIESYFTIIKRTDSNYLEIANEWLRIPVNNEEWVTLFERIGSTLVDDKGNKFSLRSGRTLVLREPGNNELEDSIREHIIGWYFSETDLQAARLPYFIPQHPANVPLLEGDFSNLSAFLYALYHLQRSDFDAIVEALNRSIELPNSIKIKHDGTRGGQNARYSFVEKAFGEERFIPPESMSDGTISLLGHLALFLADRSITLACLEEPNNGLHPRIMIHLVDAMRQAINRERIDKAGHKVTPQIIATTHSPEFMDCFDLTQEADYLQVYIVERNELGQTIFTPATADEFAPWLEKYHLGEAVRRRFI